MLAITKLKGGKMNSKFNLLGWRRFTIILGTAICGVSSGCHSLVLETADYSQTKEFIRETHTDITIEGHVIDRDASPYDFADKHLLIGHYVIFGQRKQIEFQMRGEGEGTTQELICQAGDFQRNFSASIRNVQWADIVFVVDGYEPVCMRITVPKVSENSPSPSPIVIHDAVIVMHRCTHAVATPKQ
jgi:hypothetical protein